MIAAIDEQKDALSDLCQRYQVRTLDVFGSAADGTFQPDSSDLDFLVEFRHVEAGQHYECYFGLLEGLERLFGRKVDLVDAGAMRNPYFIRRVNESRKPVYGT